MNHRFKRVPLTEVMTVDRRGIIATSIDSETPYIGLESISSDGRISKPELAGAADIRSNKHQFTEKHILFGKLRPYLRKVAIADFSGVCSTDILPLLPNSLVHQRYLFHWLRTDEIIDRATKESAGANLPRLSPTTLLRFEIPLPSLDEQKRIAAVLDQADAIRRQRQESLRLTERLVQSTFINMFGDPDSMSQMKLADLLTKPLRNGLSPASGGAHSDTVFTLSAITRGSFNSDARRVAMFLAPPRPAVRVNMADFLICRGNGNLRLCGKGQFPTEDIEPLVCFPGQKQKSMMGRHST